MIKAPNISAYLIFKKHLLQKDSRTIGHNWPYSLSETFADIVYLNK